MKKHAAVLKDGLTLSLKWTSFNTKAIHTNFCFFQSFHSTEKHTEGIYTNMFLTF